MAHPESGVKISLWLAIVGLQSCFQHFGVDCCQMAAAKPRVVTDLQCGPWRRCNCAQSRRIRPFDLAQDKAGQRTAEHIDGIADAVPIAMIAALGYRPSRQHCEQRMLFGGQVNIDDRLPFVRSPPYFLHSLWIAAPPTLGCIVRKRRRVPVM